MRRPLLLLAALLAMLNASLVTARPAAIGPNPSLTPRQVVERQLAALKTVDQPFKDAGFATVFNFTSPENRAQSGPFPRFAQMIRSGFGELINHKKSHLAATLQQGAEAAQPVEITSVSGRVTRYIFILRRQQQGEYKGCWMTDGVLPQQTDSGQSQEL